MDRYLHAFNKLSPEIKSWESSKRFVERLEAIRKTQIGRVIDDFQQADQGGKQVKFSSFRGKYVLIELWASWCLPCRKKNPGLVSIQQKYAGNNFTIVGVALEQKNDRQKWLDAIKKDGLTWPQLSDFKFWDNAVAKQFGIRSIPFNLLVDPAGKIIGRNVYEEELDKILAAILKK